MSTPTADTPIYRLWANRARAAAAAGAERAHAWRVVRVVAVFVGLEWLAVLALARSVHHNGWMYYQGGDQIWYYTLGWLLGHGQLTHTAVGYGWTILLTPLTWIFGPNLVAALPAIVLFNVLVLLPAAMAALYGIAARIGGTLFGYWTLLLWLVVPFLGIRYTNVGFHQQYTELTLPQSFGLTALSDFPTMVAALVSLYFCARIATGAAVRRAWLLDGAAAGAAAGFAIAVKPSTSLFLLGPALMFLWTRRFTAMGAFAAAMIPTLAALAVWKGRGLGNLPILSGAGNHTGDLAAAGPVVGLAISKYFSNLNWSHLALNIDQLREHFWSGRLLVWLLFAGLIGLGRRSRWAVLLLGGALLPMTIVKASYTYAQVQDTSIFRLLMPCFPIFIVLLASVPLLLPGAPARLAEWRPAFREPAAAWRAGLLTATLVISGLVPLVAFAAASTGSGSATAATVANGSTAAQAPIPADIGAVGLTGTVSHGAIHLRWHAQKQSGGRVFYRVWRGMGDSNGLTCPPSPGARWCVVGLPEIRETPGTTYVDRPDPGHWTYRVGVAANWLDDPDYGDVYFFSKAVTVNLPPR